MSDADRGLVSAPCVPPVSRTSAADAVLPVPAAWAGPVGPDPGPFCERVGSNRAGVFGGNGEGRGPIGPDGPGNGSGPSGGSTPGGG